MKSLYLIGSADSTRWKYLVRVEGGGGEITIARRKNVIFIVCTSWLNGRGRASVRKNVGIDGENNSHRLGESQISTLTFVTRPGNC